MRDGRPERPLRGALGSTWIHWWSPVASAKSSIARCSIVTHSLGSSSRSARALELRQGELGGHALTVTFARRALRSSLPTGVSGSEPTTCTSRGYL